LLNLLSNAVKFTDEGAVTLRVNVKDSEAPESQSMTEISTPVASSTLQHSNPVTLHFEVSDTGIGIPEEKREEIFSPFVQIGRHIRTIEGTGLGLAISRQLVELMGGTLNLTSEEGSGSTFWFEIALPEVERSIAEQGLSGKNVIGFLGEPRKVLVVDDKWENRMVIVNLLRPLGFEVAEAENGAEAVRLAIEWKPDLLVMDLVMPVMSGFEASQKIRQISSLCEVKILAFSASTSETKKRESLVMGCDDFVDKPVRAEELFEKIGVLLNLEWKFEEIWGKDAVAPLEVPEEFDDEQHSARHRSETVTPTCRVWRYAGYSEEIRPD
jgi:CheY-like chemotaxis protein